jgi:hypothetical protein
MTNEFSTLGVGLDTMSKAQGDRNSYRNTI